MESLEIPLDFEILQSQNPTEQPSSAVFFLHGYGANELDLSSLSRHFPSDIFIISLRAPFPLSSGYCWYPINLSPTGEIPDQPEPDSLNQSIDLINKSRDAVIELYNLEPHKIGLLGFSQGTILSLSLLCKSPSDYSWCIGFSGYLPTSFFNSSHAGLLNKPVFLSAGIADELIPLHKIDKTKKKLEELGCDVTFSSHPGGHYIEQSTLMELQQWISKHVP
ncbi:MAG TPA: phospholipase [Halobacteriales archaeon]|nr:phospholipase [Halobacteriales archaeon]